MKTVVKIIAKASDWIAIGLVLFISIFIIYDFYATAVSLNSSPIIKYISEDTNLTSIMNKEEIWATKGQIGDLFSGHAASLAFLGLILSIYFQIKSVKAQTMAIEMQVAGMDDQRKEFQQTNLSIKFNRLYQTLLEYEKNITYNVDNEEDDREYFRDLITDANAGAKKLSFNFLDIQYILMTYEYILKQIELISDVEIKKDYMSEFKIRLYNTDIKTAVELYLFSIFQEYFKDAISIDVVKTDNTDIYREKEYTKLVGLKDNTELKKTLEKYGFNRLYDLFCDEIRANENKDIKEFNRKFTYFKEFKKTYIAQEAINIFSALQVIELE